MDRRFRSTGFDRFRRLTFSAQRCDDRVYGDTFASLVNKDLKYFAFIDGFHFHGRLIGLDFSDHVAGLHIITDLLQPFRELALGHGGESAGIKISVAID